MNLGKYKNSIKSNPKLKEILFWMLRDPRRKRPRIWIKWFVNPFFHKRGSGALVRFSARVDVFPYNKFDVGKNSTVEDFCVVNNGAGDIIIGDRCRVGIGTVMIGPVTMGNGAGTGQHVFLGGFNHGYEDGTLNSSLQAIVKKPIIIEDEAHIGANSVVVAGVTIGKRCQIGAGSVVTKSIPPFSVAVGNPAKVIKQFNHETSKWEKVINHEKS